MLKFGRDVTQQQHPAPIRRLLRDHWPEQQLKVTVVILQRLGVTLVRGQQLGQRFVADLSNRFALAHVSQPPQQRLARRIGQRYRMRGIQQHHAIGYGVENLLQPQPLRRLFPLCQNLMLQPAVPLGLNALALRDVFKRGHNSHNLTLRVANGRG